jgi:hypothetical protein
LNLQGMRVYLGGPLDVPGGELDVYAEATHQLTAWGAKVLSPHDFGLAEDDPVHPETAAALRAAIEADAAALHNADLVAAGRQPRPGPAAPGGRRPHPGPAHGPGQSPVGGGKCSSPISRS